MRATLNALLPDARTELLVRPRVNALLGEATQKPLTIVCAGAGYGKTQAVYEFARRASVPCLWMQFSERDNAGSRFWAKYVRLAAGWDENFARQCKALGFPDSEDKLNRYVALLGRHTPNRPHLFVLDDIHLVQQPAVLRFLERRLNENIKNTSVILVCRELPALNLGSIQVRGLINEDDLRFTESELALYLSQQGLCVPRQIMHDIMADTDGWAFSINLVAHSLKKSPGYAGYARAAVKESIFKLMEAEMFTVVSPGLQQLLVRLSLIDHLSAELVAAFAKGDEALLSELGRQNAYARFDSGVHAYWIHHLFLDFLRTRQPMLTQQQVRETYQIAADWCRQNGFETDALHYLEKIGNYDAIVRLLAPLPVQMPVDVALCAADIFERAPAGLSGQVDYFAVMHVRVIVRLGHWQEAIALMRRYEEEFLRLPADSDFRNRMLGGIYYCWGNVRALLCTLDDRYDFDTLYAKMNECLAETHVDPAQYADMPIGLWASLVGSSREGAPQEYIEAAVRAANYISACLGGATMGIDALCRGELLFYQGDMRQAEPIFADVLQRAPEYGQFEIEHKAIFFLLRMALWQGNREKAEQLLRDMENKLTKESQAYRFFNYDAALGWYYCALRQPGMVPSWLREKFAPYRHAYFVENLGNQIKARYHYLTRDYAPMLAYIEGVRRRESILYGRVEMLAMKACTHYNMKDRAAAFGALRGAYQEASPNGILVPFVELGKDMRTLVSAAMHEPSCDIPHVWLETVKRKSASFAKYQSLMISSYQKASGKAGGIRLSPREHEILIDLYRGLTRLEIAAKQALSTNTVNSAVGSIFNKLGAHSVADAVRIAAEENLV